MSCISSVDGIMPCLVNYVAMLLVVCQVSRDVIGYEYCSDSMHIDKLKRIQSHLWFVSE